MSSSAIHHHNSSDNPSICRTLSLEITMTHVSQPALWRDPHRQYQHSTSQSSNTRRAHKDQAGRTQRTRYSHMRDTTQNRTCISLHSLNYRAKRRILCGFTLTNETYPNPCVTCTVWAWHRQRSQWDTSDDYGCDTTLTIITRPLPSSARLVVLVHLTKHGHLRRFPRRTAPGKTDSGHLVRRGTLDS